MSINTRPNLRIELVEMLFALAIGQVAIDVGDLIIKRISFFECPHAYSHLLLGTLVIALSWVGWQSSVSIGNIRIVNSIFSWQFVILLVDIFLVVCYFIIVKGAEPMYQKDEKGLFPPPNAYNQTLWSLIIFCLYFVWDILTKLIDTKYVKIDDTNYIKKRSYEIVNFLKRCWQTLLCLVLCFIIYKTLKQGANQWQIFIVDIMLLFVFIMFRGFKQELKVKFTTNNSQFSEADLKKINAPNYPINITEHNYWVHFVFVKILPVVFILLCWILYKKVPNWV